MGLHTGEPRRGDDRYVGIGVHRAARIGDAGHGGQVLLSSTTKELAEEDLPPGVTIVDLGERRLKDLDQPQRLYQLVIDGLPGAFGPLRTLDVELRRKRRRMYAGAALIGVVAAAVAIPVFAFGQGGSGGSTVVSGNAVAIIDPGSNKVSGQVPVGVAPAALAVGGGNLWVANTGDHERHAHRPRQRQAVHTDPGRRRSGQSGRRVRTRSGWSASAARRHAGAGQDRPAFRHGRAPAGQLPSDPGGGRRAVAAGPDGVWVASEGGCSRFDAPGTRSGPRSTRATARPVSRSARAAVWAADKFGNNVARIDPATGLVADTTPVGNEPSAVAVGADAVWVADEFDDKVVRIDPATNSVTTSIPVGHSPTGIAVGLGSVWVANSVDGTVSRIDPRTNTVVKTITVGGSPQAIAVGGGRLGVRPERARRRSADRRATSRTSSTQFDPDSLDPALAGYTPPGRSSTRPARSCSTTPTARDRPGHGSSPEVATAIPLPTDGGKTYTFTIRRGFRFSPPSNAPVTAQTFKFSIERSAQPEAEAGRRHGHFAGDIVGAPAYMAGKAKHISGVSAHGNTLTIRLTHADPTS